MSVKRMSRALRVRVSVGVPAYNEEKTIKQLLKAILSQPFTDATLEEVVVDTSGSTDATNIKVIEMLQADSRIKLISEKKRIGKSAALNTILQHAVGEVIVFIDGDVVLGESCIPILIKPFLINKEVGISSGNVMPIIKGNTFFDFMSRFIRELHHELCIFLMRKNIVTKVNGTFYAIRKVVVTSFPFYVVSDDEYASWCAQSKGYSVVYVPDAVVYTKDPVSFRDFITWQNRIIAGQIFIKKHFNYAVPTMKVPILLPVSLKLIKKYWRNFPHIVTLALLACIPLILAFKMFFQHKIPYIY